MSKKIDEYFIENSLNLEAIVKDYLNYIETIINNTSRNILSEEDKEEIASDVFYVIWKKQYELKREKNLSPYIAAITRNITKEYMKKSNLNSLNIDDLENILMNNDIEFVNEYIEEIDKINNKVSRMKEKDKEIFRKYYYASKSVKDIAKELKITEINVKTRLFRIRKKLKEGKIYG